MIVKYDHWLYNIHIKLFKYNNISKLLTDFKVNHNLRKHYTLYNFITMIIVIVY